MASASLDEAAVVGGSTLGMGLDEPQVEVVGPAESQSGGVGSAVSAGQNMQQAPVPRPQHVVNTATGQALLMATPAGLGDQLLATLTFGMLGTAGSEYRIGVAPVQDHLALKWMIESVGDNVVHIRNTLFDAMLDSNTDREVYGLAPNRGSYQKWYAEVDGEGFWTFKNYATGFMLDSGGEDVVYTHTPNDGAFQRWSLTDA